MPQGTVLRSASNTHIVIQLQYTLFWMKYQTPQQLANVGMLALVYVYKRIQGL